MNNPIVSIIIPTYGGADLLTRALESIKNQTLKEWEVLVVDDNGLGTPNQIGTAKVMDAYSEDHRIKYICHDINKNGSAARNTGAKASKGTYLCFLDDDDEYYPCFLQSQVNSIIRQPSNCGMIYCSYDQYYNGKRCRTVNAEKNGYLLYETLLHSFEIPTSSWLIRREVYEEMNGFDESFRRHQDWEFLNRVAAKFKINSNIEVCYKRHIGYRNSPKSPDQFIAYRKHYLEKMQDVIALLPSRKQKKVIISNKLDAIIPLLKIKKFRRFINEYFAIHPGIYGCNCIVRRILNHYV